MSKYCVMCGNPIPDNQGSTTCSMCYGDINHGKNNYYKQWLEENFLKERGQEEQSEPNK